MSCAVDNGEWKAFNVGRHGPIVSHLMFADDLLLFGEDTVKQIDYVLNTLKKLCTMYRQQVSQDKTRIYFSKNVNNSV